MALDATQNSPVNLLGPDGDRPDPSTLLPGYLYKPRGVARIDVVEYDDEGNRVYGSVPGPIPFSIPTNPTYYVSPSGNDNNDGSVSAPFQTIDHALRLLSLGWYGLAQIKLRAGTNTIGNRTVLPAPIGSSSTTAGGLLIDGVDNTDSGLGARTANGGTTGTAGTIGLPPTFGTVIDSAGGLVTNAWEGWFIRFTSGATLSGRSFQIASNSATTFTIVGAMPVAPTTETFVVEQPAGILSWSGTEVMQGTAVVGFQNVAFSGGGGSNALRLGGLSVGLQKCTFASLGSGGLQLRNRASLTDLLAIQSFLGTTSVTQLCGSYFNGVGISANLSSTSGPGGGDLNLNQCLFRNSSTEIIGRLTMQYRTSYFVGNSWVRLIYGAEGLFAFNRFNTVTPAPSNIAVVPGALGAAIVFSHHASGIVSTCDISDTPATTAPGDAILCEDVGMVEVDTTTGTGNAGVGCRVRTMSSVRRNNATSLSGAGGQVQLGDTAFNWSDLSTIKTDTGQLCLGSPH